MEVSIGVTLLLVLDKTNVFAENPQKCRNYLPMQNTQPIDYQIFIYYTVQIW